MPPVNVGDEAPDFTLKTAGGDDFRLSDLRGRNRALLLFYPEDFTSG
jgi:peroxiredoxin Q/BCP